VLLTINRIANISHLSLRSHCLTHRRPLVSAHHTVHTVASVVILDLTLFAATVVNIFSATPIVNMSACTTYIPNRTRPSIHFTRRQENLMIERIETFRLNRPTGLSVFRFAQGLTDEMILRWGLGGFRLSLSHTSAGRRRTIGHLSRVRDVSMIVGAVANTL
jgi:hypothetical protein